MGVPCADDVMLNYQSTSYHDAASVRRLLGLRPAPEFEAWLEGQGIMKTGVLQPSDGGTPGRMLRGIVDQIRDA
jgi:ethanolamine ammonia-lyase large subunit